MADQTQTEEQKRLLLETQVTTLTNERDTLKEQLAKASTDSAAASQQLATALETGKKLTAENATLKAGKEAAEKQVEQALLVVKEQKEQLAELVSGSRKIPTVKVGSDTYEFTSDFFYKDQEITLETLQNNAELAKEVVREGIANLRKVIAKKA